MGRHERPIVEYWFVDIQNPLAAVNSVSNFWYIAATMQN